MPKTDDNTAEIMIEHLRYMRAKLDYLSDAVGDLQRDNLSIRNEMHGFRGDILRVENTLADVKDDVGRIKQRLELVDA